MIRRPPRSTQGVSSAASDVYKRQVSTQSTWDNKEDQESSYSNHQDIYFKEDSIYLKEKASDSLENKEIFDQEVSKCQLQDQENQIFVEHQEDKKFIKKRIPKIWLKTFKPKIRKYFYSKKGKGKKIKHFKYIKKNLKKLNKKLHKLIKIKKVLKVKKAPKATKAKVSKKIKKTVKKIKMIRKMIIVGGCLLYTSPSPRDLSTSRMPSSA
eukprot:TRINITY_DN14156_c0_g1_i4.p1 TRINITY_DN14156_c0_g1~~TRINITY_DN14156_c0_g1_i4.p1  ORF type:complete len:210 (-),score=58.85 TRINITY_DN14156_c0_g1_i4:118-747(-)